MHLDRQHCSIKRELINLAYAGSSNTTDPTSGRMSMFSDFIIGSAVGLIVMIVHLLSTLAIYYFVHLIGTRMNERRVVFLVISLIVLYLILFLCVCLSVSIWALTYYQMGFAGRFSDAFYTAMLNYTTLGPGGSAEILKTRLFGPMTAASGILMFGWAVSLMVYIIQLHLPAILKDKWGGATES